MRGAAEKVTAVGEPGGPQLEEVRQAAEVVEHIEAELQAARRERDQAILTALDAGARWRAVAAAAHLSAAQVHRVLIAGR